MSDVADLNVVFNALCKRCRQRSRTRRHSGYPVRRVPVAHQPA